MSQGTTPRPDSLQMLSELMTSLKSATHEAIECELCGMAVKLCKAEFNLYSTEIKWSVDLPLCPWCLRVGLDQPTEEISHPD